jgi:putative tryptophan/tyrosine transport system substrate-binding protein
MRSARPAFRLAASSRASSPHLPIMQLTKFELVINLRIAKALGIDVPPGVHAIADAIIE